jgi:hypothetical protein
MHKAKAALPAGQTQNGQSNRAEPTLKTSVLHHVRAPFPDVPHATLATSS